MGTVGIGLSGAQIDIASLERDRDQLYAEAVQLYRAGSAWHLTDDEVRLALAEQQERVYATELEQDVQAYLDTVKGDEVPVRSVHRIIRGMLCKLRLPSRVQRVKLEPRHGRKGGSDDYPGPHPGVFASH